MQHLATATYSPEDDKLRLYPFARLDSEDYARVKKAGFSWAGKQELFYAVWSPEREDLAIEFAGEIDDEDTTLVDRAEARADRFEDYHESRAEDAERARVAVSSIADNIPLGQPILVGHHSEKHARKDAERIENGMRKAVKMWGIAQYWTDRAAGARRHAKYLGRPDVRARRIKKIEAAARKFTKEKKQSEGFLQLWQREGLTHEQARQIANHDHVSKCFTLEEYPRGPEVSQYEGMMSLYSALEGIITAEQAQEIAVRVHERMIAHRTRWIEHTNNRLAYERAMLGESGGIPTDKTKPEKGGAVRCWASPNMRGAWSYIQKVNKVSLAVLDNWGNGGEDFRRTIKLTDCRAVMSRAEVEAKREAGQLVEIDARGFVLTDAPRPEPPKPDPEPTQEAQQFEAMKDQLRDGGVKAVSAPQLFPTPRALAQRMVQAAALGHGRRVLEPSAGTGRLLDLIHASHEVTAVELNVSLAERLRETYPDIEVRCCDFLSVNGELGTFERIVMNPPYQNGADIKHIQYAMGLLEPGGRLVALCADGPRQNETLKPLADSWEALGSAFEDEGTGVRVALMTYNA